MNPNTNGSETWPQRTTDGEHKNQDTRDDEKTRWNRRTKVGQNLLSVSSLTIKTNQEIGAQ